MRLGDEKMEAIRQAFFSAESVVGGGQYVAQDLDRPLAQILEVARALVRGNFDKEAAVDSEGVIAQIAGEVNQIVRNLRAAVPPLSQVTEQTPGLAETAQSVAALMNSATLRVLDSSDGVIATCDKLEAAVGEGYPGRAAVKEHVKGIKSLTFDIIAQQSYQDAARQKLELLEKDLEKIRDVLVDVLVVMNLREDDSEENLEAKRNKLRKVSQAPEASQSKQDLVDELLAEFGL